MAAVRSTSTAAPVLLLEGALSAEEIGPLMTEEQFLEIEDYKEIPFVDWNVLNSTQFLRGLENLDAQGLLPGWEDPELLQIFTPEDGIVSKSGVEMLYDQEEKYGFAGLWSYENRWKLVDHRARPWRVIVFRTKFYGHDATVPVYTWLNQDGTRGFFGMLVGSANNEKNMETLRDALRRTSAKIPVGRRYASEELRRMYSPFITGEGPREYADWVQAESAFIATFLAEWQRDGILSNQPLVVDGEEIERLPITTAGWAPAKLR
jgi:hypothetical protein